MKHVIVLIVTFLSSIVINAQNLCIEFWGKDGFDFNGIKNEEDSLLYLSKKSSENSFTIYKNGKKVDELFFEKKNRNRRLLVYKKGGKFYIGKYEIKIDCTLLNEIETHGTPIHSSHFSYSGHHSHSSHSSHYSSIK